MFVPLWVLAPAVLLLLWLLSRVLSGSRGDMVERQQRAAVPVSPELQTKVLADPETRAAIEAGRKIDAIRLVRERAGLGLKEAKDLIDSQLG